MHTFAGSGVGLESCFVLEHVFLRKIVAMSPSYGHMLQCKTGFFGVFILSIRSVDV